MITGLIGLMFGLVAGACLLVGLIPLLGWLNWFTSLPLALIGLIFSRISAKGESTLGTVGTLLCGGIIIVAILRLFLGWGVV